MTLFYFPLLFRSLFDYDPSKDEGIPSRGLPFKFGDVLHVTNASDEDWWQARRVLNQGEEGDMGLVPSRTRWEKKVRARHRSEKQNFNKVLLTKFYILFHNRSSLLVENLRV